MHQTLNSQIFLSLTIVGIIFIVGLYIFFSKPEEKIVIKKVLEKSKKKQIDFSGLTNEEKKAIKEIQKEKGVLFQADLKERLGIGKVGMTRLLDKLESKQIIERRRRGMNNIVILKK